MNNTRTIDCHVCGSATAIDMTSYALLDNKMKDHLSWMLKRITCDTCYGAGRAERLKKGKERRFKLSGIPTEFTAWDRDKGNNRMAEWVWKYRRESLLISDDYGTGKTRSVCTNGAHVCENKKVLFFRTVDLLKSMSQAFGVSMFEANTYTNEIKKCDLLILDDFGKEKLTERTGEAVYDIIDYRYIHKKKIWITTNLSGAEMKNKLGEDRGKAVVRRLSEMCLQWETNEELLCKEEV